jgi:hypothetical protein
MCTRVRVPGEAATTSRGGHPVVQVLVTDPTDGSAQGRWRRCMAGWASGDWGLRLTKGLLLDTGVDCADPRRHRHGAGDRGDRAP